MALSGTDNKTSFTATASQTTFTFTIPFFDATTVDVSAKKFGDIKVTREAASDGTLTELTPNASPSTVDQFKIAATNNDPSQGCTVTIGAGATANDIYTVERDVKTTQQYDLQEGSTIDPTALNKAFDRIVAQNQQQNDKLNNSITFPATDASTITYNVDSSASSRANKALGFDSSGNITELSLVSAGSVAGNTNAGISVSDNTISATIDTQHMEFNGGNISIKADGITGTEIAGGSITFDLLASNAVTTAKIKDSTSKTDGVTLAKLQHISTDKVLGKLSAGEGDVEEITVDEDLSSVSANHDSLATAKAIKDYVDNYNIDKHYYIYQTGNARNGATDGIWVGWSEICKTTGATHIASYDNSTGIFTFASTGTYYVDLSFHAQDRDLSTNDKYYVVIGKGDNSDEQSDTMYTHGDVTAADINAVPLKNMAVQMFDTTSGVLAGLNNKLVGVITVSDVSTDKLRCHTNEVGSAALDHWEARAIMKIMKIT